MIKFTQGWIGNDANVTKEIVVKAAAPNKLRDILIGGGLVLTGMIWLTTTAFKYGSQKFEEAEMNTLEALGLLSDSKPEN